MYENELYHYGVKGMKWGIRRDARVLANNRRNKKVRNIKKQYELGKISKEKKRSMIRTENAKKNQYLNKVKNDLKKTNDEAKIRSYKTNLSKQTIKEVPNRRLKKGVMTAKNIVTGLKIGGIVSGGASGVAIASSIANPALGAAFIGTATVNTLITSGGSYVMGKLLDKLS